MGDNRFPSVIQYATQDLFKTLPYKLVHGEREKIFATKNAIVLSDVRAIRIFGSVDSAVGKTVEWGAMDITGDFMVSGVFQSPPSDATLQFDAALNIDVFLDKRPGPGRWDYNGPYTYCQCPSMCSP